MKARGYLKILHAKLERVSESCSICKRQETSYILDLLGCPWLLATELVTWETKYFESLVFVLLVKLLKSLVLLLSGK